jgi:hypothetical protein
MISLFAIVFSAGMALYITLRAAKLDRMLPWFETRSMFEQERRREKAAREEGKYKVNHGRRSDTFGVRGSAAAAAAARGARR